MIQPNDIPDGWHELNTEFTQQKQAFQRPRDGLIVSIEFGTGHQTDYSAVTLPENFVDDHRVIDVIHDSNDRTEVEEQALVFMEENER
ncbi:hypothetical protein [Halomonas sp.]|uniref:hypothetical protein n=1 Tax=Halomonas sp. TaxID=1486246 RepID=UPI003562C2FB